MKLFYIILLCIVPALVRAQSYADSIATFRKHYVEELLAEPRHPLAAAEAGKLDFFAADKSYCVKAAFTKTVGNRPFKIPTHSGKQKPFKEYGTLTFYIGDTQYILHAYQGVDMVNDAPKDYLFIPFNDLTNYESTYGGGRYIDLSVGDIKDGQILLDFNKCYNPYCAYSDGFSCPIPPDENHLQTYIQAGERVFRH